MEEILRAWVPLMVSIIALGTSGWGILQGPARKNAEAIRLLGETLGTLIEKLDARLDQTEKDVTGLKEVIKQLPTAADLHDLDKQLTALSGKVELVSESQKQSATSLKRIEDFLIGQAGGRK